MDPMEPIVSFIESNPGISFLNLQLFFGEEIKTAGFTEETLNTKCRELRPDGSVQLGEPDEVDDYVVNIPSSVFDTATDITEKHVKEICDKIALLREPIEIVLNEQVPNHAEFIDVPLKEFKIPALDAAYESVKSKKDPVSKVREMLFDFQPQLLERKSHFILNQMSIYDVKIFASISDFINAFSEKKFFDFYQAMKGDKPSLVQMRDNGNVWIGTFGALSLTIHVMHGRKGTGAGNKINAGNVIQAALFYKDRKNDFIRSNSAISMIQHCSTQWPDGRSSKEGTIYTYSDLYTGEKIVQKYDGKLPDFESPPPFVSILTNYHVPVAGKPIYTNQEHIVAVYPASCIFHDDCYYETLVANLQMISQKANSDVNAKVYESPLGKLQYVHDIHEKQKRDFVGKFYLKQIELCKNAMLCTVSDELNATYEQLMQTLTDKETELKRLEYQTKQEINNANIRLGQAPVAITSIPEGGIKIPVATVPAVTDTDKTELLKKRQELNSELLSIQINFTHFEDAKKIYPIQPSDKKDNPKYELANKMFQDLHDEMEYKTRKAILMGRLDKMEKCCLGPGNEKYIEHRRAIVLSCIDSVAIIISCAKIAVLTVTTTASAHHQLVKDAKELVYLRTLSTKLFHDYNSAQATYSATAEQTIRIIHLQQELMEIIQKQIIYSVVTKNSLELSEAMRRREAIDSAILRDIMGMLTLEQITVSQMEDAKYRLTISRVAEINACDKEISRLTGIKNKLNGEIAYILTHLAEIGPSISIELVDLANKVNNETLGLLKLLGRDTTPEFKDCMTLLARQESRYAPVAVGMVDMQNREDVFDDVGIGRTVELLSELCPQEPGTNVAVANAIASDILNGESASITIDSEVNNDWLLLKQKSDDVLRKRTRMSIDLHRMTSGLEVEQIMAKIGYRSRLLERKAQVEGPASDTPQFRRWMGRLQANEARLRKKRVQEEISESEGIRSFMYFYICNNPQSKPSPLFIRQIGSYINNATDTAERNTKIPELLSQSYPKGPKVGVGGGMSGGMAGGLEPHEIEEQMNEAITSNDVVKMYDLYIEYFDTEETKDLTLLFYQVYSILSKSIYVPLYRRHVTPLEELIHPVYVKRLDYTGDLHDFDCVYADNFCVQIFGKNVNELLDDLAKGKLTVPRGVFPNICENPFDPYSLICILEVCRFFCLFLPFAGRLQFYFAGVLSFMNQTYDVNMVQIQTDQILDYLNTPEFFQCFHAAARMYNERYNQDITPLVIDQPEPVQPEPDQPDQSDLPVPPNAFSSLRASEPLSKLNDPRSVSSPPGTTPPGTPGGGTRRYRRYKQKTKRQTLNKRFKRHRTRRLHGSHVRE